MLLMKFLKWDDLDFLFNRAKWKIKDEERLKKLKKKTFTNY